MALQVWLPLTGDLTQQGLSGVEVTNNGATINNEGKLGKCYQFDGSNDYINIPATVAQNLSGDFSLAFWVNFPSLNTSYQTIIAATGSSASWAQEIFCFQRNGTTSNFIFTIANGSSATQANLNTAALATNTWYHFVCTYTVGKISLYQDGQHVETYSTTIIPNFDSIQNFQLGRSHTGYYSNMKLNDFRLYDHCLSLKEIKEISKGLILHYKLDDPYIESTTNLNPIAKPAAAANVTWGGHVTQWTNYDTTYDPVPFNEGIKGEIVYGENGSTGGGASRSIATITAEPSTTYTYSCYIKPEDDFAYITANLIYKYEYNGNTRLVEGGLFSKSRIESVGDGWYRCWGTFTSKDTTTAINISFYTYPLKTITYWIGGWQIEKNDHMTPFVEPGGTRTGGIIFDDSGYKNNGLPIDVPIVSSDTSRYSKSTSFDGTNDGILIENLQLSHIINSEITYAFWIKPNGETGARSVYFGSYSGTSWSIEKTTNNLLRLYWNGSPDETTTGVTIVDNIWQHICITKKGTNDIKVYINGEQKWISTKEHNVLTFPTTYRIGRDVRSGDNTPYKGLISDFRIYATALSAEDIAELYHTTASVDNHGNIYTYEFEEV